MNVTPVGIASAWSSIKPDPAQAAVDVAVARDRSKPKDAVPDMAPSAPEPPRSPPPREGQGERVDRRV